MPHHIHLCSMFSISQDVAYVNDESLSCRTGWVGTVWKSKTCKHGNNETD